MHLELHRELFGLQLNLRQTVDPSPTKKGRVIRVSVSSFRARGLRYPGGPLRRAGGSWDSGQDFWPRSDSERQQVQVQDGGRSADG